jgi:hypothetical protein
MNAIFQPSYYLEQGLFAWPRAWNPLAIVIAQRRHQKDAAANVAAEFAQRKIMAVGSG